MVPGLLALAVAFLALLQACGSPAYLRNPEGLDGGGFGDDGLGSGGRAVLGTGGAGTGGVAVIGTGGTGTAGAPSSGGRGSGGAASGGRGTGGASTGGRGSGGAASGGRGTGGAGTGGGGGGTASGGAGTGGATDLARYNFEAGAQGWTSATDAGLTPFTSVGTSTAQRFAGASSLAGTVTLPANGLAALVALPPVPPPTAGMQVTYHVLVPASAIDWVQPYVQEVGPSFQFTPPLGGAQLFTAGTFDTFTVTVPATSVAIGTLGVQFHSTTGGTATVYVDSISY